MPKYAINIVLVMVLAVVAIFAVLVLTIKGLIQPDIPLPGDKARFLRYLKCEMAMCAYGCKSPEVIDIWLDGEKKGCYDFCKETAMKHGVPLTTHMCDRDYKIKFVFNRSVTYIGNYSDSRWQTDASKSKWGGKALDCACARCMHIGRWIADVRPVGKIAWHAGGCGRESSGSNTWYSGTIWIPENLKDDCVEDPNLPMYKPDNTLGYCNFQEGQEIYIWAEDARHTDSNCYSFILEGCIGRADHTCPQIIICDHP